MSRPQEIQPRSSRYSFAWIIDTLLGFGYNRKLIFSPPESMTATLKEFLEACETLGTLRLIVTNEVAVLEARGTIQKLFYAELPKGKYANMHQEGFDFHLNMDQVQQVKFETGQAKRGDFTTYAIRFLDAQEKPGLSLFLQWGKPGEYAPGQVEAWQSLREKYDELWTPEPVETL